MVLSHHSLCHDAINGMATRPSSAQQTKQKTVSSLSAFVVVLMLTMDIAAAFVPSSPPIKERLPLVDKQKTTTLMAPESFQTLLDEMQKSEEALLLQQQQHDNGEQKLYAPEELTPVPHKNHDNNNSPLDTTTVLETDSNKQQEQEPFLEEMDFETARELDHAVMKLSPELAADPEGITLVPESTAFLQDTPSPTTPSSRRRPLLFVKDTLMERDRCHLAVSIAAAVTRPEQWQLFCHENNGMMPLIMAATFLSAACRALRDLCTLSSSMAAVVTDGLLRANVSWQGRLLQDFTRSLASSDNNSSMEQRRCQLYVLQLLLEMTMASDDAVEAIRSHPGLTQAIVQRSSYGTKQKRKGWWSRLVRRNNKGSTARRRLFRRRPVMAKNNDLNGQVERNAHQILAAIGYNPWIRKSPHQRGIRVLSLDGGGSRGMVAVKAAKCLMEATGNGADLADSFDLIVGTSTGGIIAFLVGLQKDSSAQAVKRYEQLIGKIFIKSALSTPLMLFTTASYDESHFMKVLTEILGDETMLDSRADPAVPYVCALASKMSSTPTHVALFRNYNYADNERADPFTMDPDEAREQLDLPLSLEHEDIRKGKYPRKVRGSVMPGSDNDGRGSRHPGSFRVLQRYALRASTAAPTVFKPVLMGGEMYCDGGIIASNPSAVALHEARALFPDVPIELIVSLGTGAFVEQKSPARVGWDGIISQIVNSATESEQIHHVLDDILGENAVVDQPGNALSKTTYFRFNPTLGPSDLFPIDETNPDKILELQEITAQYMAEPAQQAKMKRVADILRGQKRRRVPFLSRRP